MADRSVLVLVAGFLQDSRAIVAEAPSAVVDRARARLRKGWGHVRDGDPWLAVVCALDARVMARAHPEIDRRAEEGLVLCDALRAVYPTAPPGFERCGRSATGGD